MTNSGAYPPMVHTRLWCIPAYGAYPPPAHGAYPLPAHGAYPPPMVHRVYIPLPWTIGCTSRLPTYYGGIPVSLPTMVVYPPPMVLGWYTPPMVLGWYIHLPAVYGGYTLLLLYMVGIHPLCIYTLYTLGIPPYSPVRPCYTAPSCTRLGVPGRSPGLSKEESPG